MVGILVAMAFIPEQRQPLWFGVASLGVLLLAYLLRVRKTGAGFSEPDTLEYRHHRH
jgi:GABA permease